jgi:protein-disulfide isomerase
MAHRSIARRSGFRPSLLAGLLGFGIVAVACAQEGASAKPATAGSEVDRLRADIENLKQGQAAIQKDLAEIKAMLRSAPQAAQGPAQPSTPVNATISLGDRPLLGSTGAKLAIIEFSDYQCPYCARFTKTTYPRLEQEFIKSGKVRYTMLDFPLANHQFAFKAAEAAGCAASDGKFWEMHHLLFENQQRLQPEALPNYAEQVGLDRKSFEACLSEGRKEQVDAGLEQARSVGVSATPTFLIGWLADGGKVQVKEMIRGAKSYEDFERVLNKMLEAGKPTGSGD